MASDSRPPAEELAQQEERIDVRPRAMPCRPFEVEPNLFTLDYC